MRRRFNAHERSALYHAAGGRCEECDVALEPGWHADHVHPWTHGGITDVLNGAALCPECNLKKGTKTLHEDPRTRWQEKAIVADQILTEHALVMLGLAPLRDEDDLDDWVLRTCYWINVRQLKERVLLLAHWEAQGLALPERSWRLNALDLIAARDHLGYVLSDAEQAAVDAEEDPEVEQVAS